MWLLYSHPNLVSFLFTPSLYTPILNLRDFSFTCYYELCDFSLSDTVPSPPSDVTAVQAGITSIRVTWIASSNATGYRIHYTSDSDSGSETVSGGSTETHTLTGLVNGVIYTISVAATSQHFPSEAVAADATISLRKDFVSTLFYYTNCLQCIPPSFWSACCGCELRYCHQHLYLPLLECP